MDQRSIFSAHEVQDYQSCSDYLDFISNPDSQDSDSIETLHEDTPSCKKDKMYSLFEKYNDNVSTSLMLENKCSVARDHLANERTYLAWIRTSLSLISVGIGLTQLFHFQNKLSDSPYPYGKPLGLCFILLGILYLLSALLRYFHIQTSMTHNYFPSSQSTILITAIFTFIALFTAVISLK